MGILKSYIQRDHTDLNELRYKDSATIGNEPIVQKKIPNTLESKVPSSNEFNKRVDDLKRIARIFTQPGGIKYLGNEASLYTLNLPSEPGLKGKAAMLGKGLLNTAKVLGSTLAQVPLNGTGTHFVKGFLPDRKKYVNQFKETVRKEGRLQHGDPGKSYKAYYEEVDPEVAADKINTLNPIQGDAIGLAKGDGSLNDLIKFRFTIVTPDREVMLPFRAYLDNFNDSYNSSWNSFKYLGRAEDFHTYQGMDRTINLGFKIAAQTRSEMKPLYRKMVFLASSVAPTYSNNIMRGTFVKMTVGSYVNEIPGYITNLNYSWNTDYPWEIALNKKLEGNTAQKTNVEQPDIDQQELPMVLDCTLSFTPIHKFAPQTGMFHYFTDDNPTRPEQLFFPVKKKPVGEVYAEGTYDDWVNEGEKNNS